MRRALRAFLVAFLMMISFSAFSEERPEQLLERVTEEMLAALKNNDKAIKSNQNKLFSIVEKILVPHVDVYDMSRWVVGRNAWLTATPSQRSRFADEFKDLMIRTYSTSLTAYSNQTIVYIPIREDISEKQRVQVSSQILESGRTPINVTYRLVHKDGTWKVYDIIIEGVSLLKGFKEQFAPDIQQNGMDSVIKKMRQHNASKVN